MESFTDSCKEHRADTEELHAMTAIVSYGMLWHILTADGQQDAFQDWTVAKQNRELYGPSYLASTQIFAAVRSTCHALKQESANDVQARFSLKSIPTCNWAY